MKTLLLSVASLFLILGSVTAQSSYWAVKGDVNYATEVGPDADGFKPRAGFSIGVLRAIPINSLLSLVPELKYTNIGVENNNGSISSAFNYVAFPLMLQLNLTPFLALELGPQFAYLIDAKAKVGGFTVDYTDQCEKFDLAMGAGLVLDLHPVFLTGRYYYSFTSVVKDSDLHHAVLSLGIGVKF